MLFALDVADVGARGDEAIAVRKAIRVITTKLWPELGDLLDGDEQ